MDVSENNGTPKYSILIGISIINHPFWGTPIFGNSYIYIYLYNLMIFDVYRKCCVFSKFSHSFPQSRITIRWNHKDSNIPLFLPCISAIFAPCRCNTRQRTIRSSSPEKAIHKVEEDKPSEFLVGKCREASGAKTYQWIWMIWIWIVVLQD